MRNKLHAMSERTTNTTMGFIQVVWYSIITSSYIRQVLSHFKSHDSLKYVDGKFNYNKYVLSKGWDPEHLFDNDFVPKISLVN